MRIDHTAIYVNDLEGAREFFERYLGGVSGERYHNPKTGFSSYFLSFDADGKEARLEVMTRPDLADDPKDALRSGWAHLSFGAGSVSEVDLLTAQLATDGFEVISGPRTTGDGYYESSVIGPEGNVIEITV